MYLDRRIGNQFCQGRASYYHDSPCNYLGSLVSQVRYMQYRKLFILLLLLAVHVVHFKHWRLDTVLSAQVISARINLDLYLLPEELGKS